MQRNSVIKTVEILAKNNFIKPDDAIKVTYESFDWERAVNTSEWIFSPNVYDEFLKKKRVGIKSMDVEEEGGHHFIVGVTYKNRFFLPDSDDVKLHSYMPSVKPLEIVIPIGEYTVSLNMRGLEKNYFSLRRGFYVWTKDHNPAKKLPKEINETLKNIKKELLKKREEIFS